MFVSSLPPCCVAPFVTNPNGLLMTDRDVVVSTAKRRMLRRLHSHRRHEQFSIRMALASAAHHSHMRVANMATQTDFVPCCDLRRDRFVFITCDTRIA